MTENGRISYNDLNGGLGKGCGPTLLMWGIVLAFVMLLFSGCRSVKEAETTSENHRMSELVEKMDSLFRNTSIWQQDLYSKQSSLIDSFRQNEKRDSSHTVVINEKGDTIKERIVIYHEVEKDHSSEKEESEYWMHRFEKVDSMLQISLDKQEKTDSLLREHEKIIQKQPTKWEQFRLDYGGYAIALIIILLIYAVYRLVRKFKP